MIDEDGLIALIKAAPEPKSEAQAPGPSSAAQPVAAPGQAARAELNKMSKSQAKPPGKLHY